MPKLWEIDARLIYSGPMIIEAESESEAVRKFRSGEFDTKYQELVDWEDYSKPRISE